MSITTKGTLPTIDQTLIKLKEAMSISPYQTYQAQLDDLILKQQQGLFSITFCGHFSAGKSSLINELCEHTLLPSSPIPTSANVVSIRNAAPEAKVKRWNEPIPESIVLSELQEACKQGDAIESVELSYPIDWMGENTVLLDTPGVDSTDEAHMRSTLSAIHLSDVVFYVMDYNHVMSEINFAFTKRLQEWNKPIFLIVNQIDKHDPDEIDFSEYQTGVKQAFENWHIELAEMFFITLKDKLHPHNELEQLRWYLKQLIHAGEDLREASITHSANHIVEDHIQSVLEAYEAKKTPYLEQIEAQGLEEIEQQANAIKADIARLERQAEGFLIQQKQEISKLVDNANIVPAKTRDLAHLFLESTSSKFKVGLLFSKQKTEQEKQNRLKAFCDDIKQNIEVHIKHHLHNSLKAAVQQQNMNDTVWMQHIEAVRFEATDVWLLQQVNPGAILSNEYTMTYSAQISNEIKGRFRREAFELLEKAAEKVAEQSINELAELKLKLDECSSQLQAKREVDHLDAESAAYTAELRSCYSQWKHNAFALPSKSLAPRTMTVSDRDLGTQGIPAHHDATESGYSIVENVRDEALSSSNSNSVHDRIEQTVRKVNVFTECIQGLPGLAAHKRHLEDKVQRLEKRTFTIALFGAFSAGKSSFANALIGEKVVPVSPNPTTSAINKVMKPPTPDQHGMAKIRMKPLNTILADVQYSLELLGISAEASLASMEVALKLISKLKPEHISGKGKAHYAFLKAVEQGWNEAKDQLEDELWVQMEAFRQYVAVESKSCFVEDIELYYSCPLTEQGIVLVDTPGADSINARHTGVAFNYIKNSDAILFVTYYNHAFSQADREFLIQLGRVKDSFELDKMFFVVNAADLAASPEELEGVVEHVRHNLLQFQIREANIYPVSSKLAVEGKLQNKPQMLAASGIPAFERDFMKFAIDDLVTISIDAIEKDLKKCRETVEVWLAEAARDASDRQHKINALQTALDHSVSTIQEPMKRMDLVKLEGELKELFYYVKQRYMFRFNDLFLLAFNPSTLRDEQGDRKTRMRQAMAEFKQLLNIQLSQEALALSLRYEKAIKDELQHVLTLLQEEISEYLPWFELDAELGFSLPAPEVDEEIEGLVVEEKDLLAHYKNGRQFFEENGRDKLRDQLSQQLDHIIDAYIHKHQERFNAYYQHQLEQALHQWYEAQKLELQEQVEGRIAAGSEAVQPDMLQQLLKEMDRIIALEA